MEELKRFGQIVRSRSLENNQAMTLLVEQRLLGNAISVLRQELDSMVRVIYLLSCEANVRLSLVTDMLNGKKWNVTDRKMVDYSDQYWGWTMFVYKFGCSFIHLSQYHEYLTENPFSQITEEDRTTIKSYLNQYHNFPDDHALNADTLEPYLLKIFEKIRDNMLHYLSELENGAGKEAIDIH